MTTEELRTQAEQWADEHGPQPISDQRDDLVIAAWEAGWKARQEPIIAPHDFAGWASKLITLDGSGTVAEFKDAIKSFASECGVELDDEAIKEFFRIED